VLLADLWCNTHTHTHRHTNTRTRAHTRARTHKHTYTPGAHAAFCLMCKEHSAGATMTQRHAALTTLPHNMQHECTSQRRSPSEQEAGLQPLTRDNHARQDAVVQPQRPSQDSWRCRYACVPTRAQFHTLEQIPLWPAHNCRACAAQGALACFSELLSLSCSGSTSSASEGLFRALHGSMERHVNHRASLQHCWQRQQLRWLPTPPPTPPDV
jgi:hypothetical protein